MQAGQEQDTSAMQVRDEAGPSRGAAPPLEPIWLGATDGSENLARRIAIMVTPSVAQYTTRDVDTHERERNWQARGLTVMGFTPEQLDAMRQLKRSTMEFAALSGNKYIPSGFHVEDLLRMYAALAPAVLTENDMHLRLMAVEILRLKAEARMKDESLAGVLSRLDQAEDTLQEHGDLVATWLVEEEYGEAPQPRNPQQAAAEGHQPSASRPAPADEDISRSGSQQPSRRPWGVYIHPARLLAPTMGYILICRCWSAS